MKFLGLSFFCLFFQSVDASQLWSDDMRQWAAYAENKAEQVLQDLETDYEKDRAIQVFDNEIHERLKKITIEDQKRQIIDRFSNSLNRKFAVKKIKIDAEKLSKEKEQLQKNINKLAKSLVARPSQEGISILEQQVLSDIVWVNFSHQDQENLKNFVQEKLNVAIKKRFKLQPVRFAEDVVDPSSRKIAIRRPVDDKPVSQVTLNFRPLGAADEEALEVLPKLEQ